MATATIDSRAQQTANSLANGPGASFPGVETIVLAGERMWGQWQLQPGAKVYGWQEQQGFALSGATLRITGDPLVHATFLVRFFRPQDWQNFQSQRARLLKKPVFSVATKTNYAMGIQYPELNAVGVTSVVVGKNPWFCNTGKGLWVGQVEFIQYRPAIAAIESPRATIPSVAAPSPAAADQVEAEIALHQKEHGGSR